MNKEKDKLVTFIVGLVMFVVGCFILSQKVHVSMGWYSLWGMPVGTIFIPLIAGIIWMFCSDGPSGKILTAVGTLFILCYIILNIRMTIWNITLFDWIIILILIFGGIGLLLRTFLNNKSKK